ncbi:MAG TPA: 2-oxo acid dehydrogenase subunit E2 [Jatrophihabitantaceae bacterium]|jgi:2-oxoglutarate dehydrogenase E2 component (dihydrolipoamide succinyltransferase)
MSVSVTMPRLGESVTEGTVTRWLKNEGDHVDADEPLLEVSTDKVDTEVPSPASGTLTSIKVQEDETVEIGVELAVIGDDGASAAPAEAAPAQQAAPPPPAPAEQAAPPAPAPAEQAAPAQQEQPAPAAEPAAPAAPAQEPQPAQQAQAPQPAPAAQPAPADEAGAGDEAGDEAGDDDDLAGTYVTPLVRKLASEHGVDLTAIAGTGVGGRIRKSDVLAAAERNAAVAEEPVSAPAAVAPAPATAPATTLTPEPFTPPAPTPVPSAVPDRAPNGAPSVAAATATVTAPTTAPATAPAVQESAPAPIAAAATTRGHTEKMSRLRQTIAARMVESLQVSAQLTTVIEVDVTKIARLRDRAKASFEAREGVKLSFLPFFAVAAVEALKAHPAVNSSIDTEAKTITYHDAEHLGIAVDTERGLLAPVIHNAGDLNLSGLARSISDLAERTRTNRISPDELSGGTFTLTNTGSRGALFDTPILNQPQVGILGTGAVVKRPVVVSDPELGETIAIRSMVYLALTYDHRIVDGADAARFLGTVKDRLQAGNFERALGLL